MVAREVAVDKNNRRHQPDGTKPNHNNHPRERSGATFYWLLLLAALAAAAMLIFAPPAHAKPSNAAQRPMEIEILRIAQTAQGTANPAQNGVRDVTFAELQEELATNRGPIIVEFYRTGYPDDPNIADDCDNCANQLPVFQRAAQHYAGKITFLRFNVDLHPQFMQLGLVVYPTHIFVEHSSTTLWTRSIRGFLDDSGLEDAILQLYKIQP